MAPKKTTKFGRTVKSPTKPIKKEPEWSDSDEDEFVEPVKPSPNKKRAAPDSAAVEQSVAKKFKKSPSKKEDDDSVDILGSDEDDDDDSAENWDDDEEGSSEEDDEASIDLEASSEGDEDDEDEDDTDSSLEDFLVNDEDEKFTPEKVKAKKEVSKIAGKLQQGKMKK